MTSLPMWLRPSQPEPYELPVSGSLAVARWFTALAGVALFVAAAMGVLYGEQGLYQTDNLLLPQIYGQDATAIVLILPLLAVAVWRASRGSARGLVLWAGSLVYMAYWYHFLLAGVDFGPLFLLHAMLVGNSLFASAALLARVDVERLAHRFGAATPVRPIGGLMVGLGTLFATAWIVDVVEALRHREVLDYAARAVYMADLTVMLPAMIVAGLLLWRHQTWGYVLSGPLLVNATLSMLTLCVTSIVVRMSGAEVAAAELVTFPVAALVMGGCTFAYLRSMRV